MNALKIFSQNWLDENCTITPSSGDATKAKFYDQKQATQWLSEGSNDAVEESVEISFNNWQAEAVDRTFNRIIILNHNLKTCAFDYWDGAAWQVIAEAAMTAETEAYTYIELATPVSATIIRMRPATTQVVDAEKAIGELKFCNSIIDGAQQWLSSLPRSDDQQSGSQRTGEGRIISWREWTKFGAAGTISNVSLADLNLLLPYLKAAQFVTVVFYEDFDLSECYECAIVQAPNHTINRKTRLFDVSLELKEI